MKDLFISTSAIKTQPINAFEGRQIEAIPKARFINLLDWIQERVDNGDITGVGGGSSLPNQSGNNGKFLTTNGTAASWAAITSVNNLTITAPATSATLTIADGKTLTANNTLTLTGTDSSSIAFGAGGNVAYTDVANTFTQNQIFTLPTLTGSSATNGINITQTWNTTGAPTLINANLTSTAYGAGANLINISVGGNSKFKVTPYGSVLAGNGTLATLSNMTSNGYGGVGSNYYFNGVSSSPLRTTVDVVSAIEFHAGGFRFVTAPSGAANTAITFNQRANIDINGGFQITPATVTATSATTELFLHTSTFAAGAGSGNFRPISINYTLNNPGTQTGTATGIFLNATETDANGMTHNLIDLQRGGISRFKVSSIGAITNSATSIVSTPAQQFTGAWYTGGGTTNTKPHVLIEPAGATSTAWNTAGTGLGINAASGFGGNLMDLQVNGSSRLTVNSSGGISCLGTVSSTAGNIISSGNVTAGSSGYIGITSRSGFNSAVAEGLLCITNQNNSNFERLQLGGTTSAFPALQTASSNAQAGLAATFTNGSANIGTATNTYAANDVVQFTTTGTLPTGLSTGTNYFVIATGLSTTNIQVSATSGGAAITMASAGSGTHTVVRQNSATIPNGSSTWTSTFAHGLRVGDVIRLSTSSGAPPVSFANGVNYYILSIPTITTFTVGLTLGGTAITAGSTVTGAIVFTRVPAIYTRTADNSANLQLFTGNNTVTGVSEVFNTSGALRFRIADGGGANGASSRDQQFTIGLIDVSNNNGLRILALGSGKTYVDGWSEGTAKASNYDVVLGSRVFQTGTSISGNTSSETGTNFMFGFETATIPSALISMNTTTRGFLPPRMTADQASAIASPAEGLMLYVTDTNGTFTAKGWYGWDGAAWQKLNN